ncbi:cell cycle checkpoint protein RAD17-like [Thalassophryne amazonica]|nr:cell cycle checkpoint protein RAD17-like [Thalassophryne amazonica]
MPMRNQAQIAFIQDVSQLSFRRFPARLKLDVLMDKDPGFLEADSEDDDDAGQGGTVDGLPTSQPQPVTNQVQRDEEEMLIEDYISD